MVSPWLYWNIKMLSSPWLCWALQCLPPTPPLLQDSPQHLLPWDIETKELSIWGSGDATAPHGAVPERPISFSIVNFSPQFQEGQQETCQNKLLSSLSSARTLSRKTELNQGFEARRDRRTGWNVKNPVNSVISQLVHLEIIHWSGWIQCYCGFLSPLFSCVQPK